MGTIRRLSVIRGIILAIVGLGLIIAAGSAAGVSFALIFQAITVLGLMLAAMVFLNWAILEFIPKPTKKCKKTEEEKLDKVIRMLIDKFGYEGQTGYAESLQKVIGEYEKGEL